MAKIAIKPGAIVDVPTAAEIAEALTTRQAKDVAVEHEMTFPKGVIQLDGSGNASGTPAPIDFSAAGHAVALKIPKTYSWICQRITLTANPAAAAIIQFFENDTIGVNMREVIQLGTAGLYSDSFDNTMYIPAQSLLIIVVTGGSPNGQLAFNMQVELRRAQQ